MTSSGRLPSLFALAFDGLRRKFGRNLLTASGVFIGVFALTLIVSLGEGMASLIRMTVSSEDNLRQIGLSGGIGQRMSDDEAVVIEGDMTDARRARLKRAALARRRPGGFIGRRAQTLDLETLEGLAAIEHVERVAPIVLERYDVTLDDIEQAATTTIGVDVGRRRYEGRVVAGTYFSARDAKEVLLHEFLAYRWGFVTAEELDSLIGRTIVLKPMGGESRGDGLEAGMIGQALSRLDLSALTDEEREALPRIAQKLGRSFLQGAARPAANVAFELKIVGVLREMESTDPFHVIEDGNAARADLFLPQGTAIRAFFDSSVNREIGFQRAYVVARDAGKAKAVEEELRARGYTAFSVASVVERVEGLLAGITVIVGLLTGIALLVAALGIVNTMVTSVLERTREIGLWKAIGATSGQVRAVFLVEAALIGLIGGLLGLGAALLVQIPATHFAESIIAEKAAFPIRGSVFVVPAWLPIAGPLLASFVAMVAALYPAHRAARVDPVRALRHE